MIEKSPIKKIRNIPRFTRLLLYVQAGGRCEFFGCNRYLLEHHLTLNNGNFAEAAHIYAFSEFGPRGNLEGRPADINSVENLMLLCPSCHKLIDDNPVQYPVANLKKYKQNHEQRIFHVTSLGPDLKTTIVQLKSMIGDQAVAIPAAQITEAVVPRYPSDSRGHVIDLTTIYGNDQAYVQTACNSIKLEIDRIYSPGMDVETTRHISLFALAPIPLLVYLGSQLSNKIPVDLYQYHRDTKNWVWKEGGDAVEYEFKLIKVGTNKRKVALVLSLSGQIHLNDLPKDIEKGFYVYEITLKGHDPTPNFLKLRQDLVNFQSTFQSALRRIMVDHGSSQAIHIFPAIPAPIAVLCGHELLPKVDPALYVYDNDKRQGGFSLLIRINEI